MTFKIQTFNRISDKGLTLFDDGRYELADHHDVADAGVGTRVWLLGQEVNPIILIHEALNNGQISVTPRNTGGHAAQGTHPVKGIQVVDNGQHGGRIDRGPLENPLVE